MQTKWRIVGGVAVGICGVMALRGSGNEALNSSRIGFIIYWSVFLLLFAVAIFCVLLDIRHIRMQFAMAKREIFEQTLGEESFRKAMRGGTKESGNGKDA